MNLMFLLQSGEVKESIDQRSMIAVSVADDDRFVYTYVVYMCVVYIYVLYTYVVHSFKIR